MDELRSDSPERPGESPASEPNSQLSLWPLPETVLPPDLSAGAPVSGPVVELDPPWSLRDLVAFILFAAFTFISANLLSILIFSLLHDRFFPNMTVMQA